MKIAIEIEYTGPEDAQEIAAGIRDHLFETFNDDESIASVRYVPDEIPGYPILDVIGALILNAEVDGLNEPVAAVLAEDGARALHTVEQLIEVLGVLVAAFGDELLPYAPNVRAVMAEAVGA